MKQRHVVSFLMKAVFIVYTNQSPDFMLSPSAAKRTILAIFVALSKVFTGVNYVTNG